MRKLATGIFNFLLVICSFGQKIRAESLELVDVQNISFSLEQTSCCKQAGVESMVEVTIVASELCNLLFVFLVNSF